MQQKLDYGQTRICSEHKFYPRPEKFTQLLIATVVTFLSVCAIFVTDINPGQCHISGPRFYVSWWGGELWWHGYRHWAHSITPYFFFDLFLHLILLLLLLLLLLRLLFLTMLQSIWYKITTYCDFFCVKLFPETSPFLVENF